MDITIRSGKDQIHGTILHASRVGIGQGLVVVDSPNLNCSIPIKPGKYELEIRIYERSALVSSGSFSILLPANTTLRVHVVEENVVQINTDGSGAFDVVGVVAWLETLPQE